MLPLPLPPSPPASQAPGVSRDASHASPHAAFTAITAFTLVELLVVVSIIVVMMTLAIPAFNTIRGGTDFTSEVYDISSAFEQARAYAMANNTFVLVGISEVANSQSTTVNPQISGTGRLAIAILASKDGTRPYQHLLDNPNLEGEWPPAGYGPTGDFTAVTKLLSVPNMHMVDLQNESLQIPTSGGMARPSLTGSEESTSQSQYYDIPNGFCASAVTFGWPVGTGIGGTPAPQYTFTKVVEFDPQGSARIIVGPPANYLDAIPHYIEIGLQPANGTSVAPVVSGATGQIAAIQIDGMSGATRIYRP